MVLMIHRLREIHLQKLNQKLNQKLQELEKLEEVHHLVHPLQIQLNIHFYVVVQMEDDEIKSHINVLKFQKNNKPHKK